MALSPTALEALLERRGPLPARDVLRALDVSQPTLSRLTRASPRVRRVGRTRATQYALARSVRNVGEDWPIYRVRADGRLETCARLHALAPHHWWFEAKAAVPAWLPHRSVGLFDDWPWFLDDLRPQGFLGRVFARRRAPELGLPEDPRLWSADGVLAALLAFGEDLSGDFVVGDEAARRIQVSRMSEPSAIAVDDRRERYDELAEAVLSGVPVGSSAAGEQPKFTARVKEGARVREVIVKLSPPRDTRSGRRWADLLLAEHLAAERLALNGILAAKTEWIDGATRAFLEVTRFDRVGAHGRIGIVSLFALDAELYGAHDTWARAAERLLRDGWIAEPDARTLAILWWFGKLIANTDLHFGNVSLFLDEARPLKLAPAYDMLPMGLAPRGQGEISPHPPIVEPPPVESAEAWRVAAKMAVELWSAVARDPRVSGEFASEAREHEREVQRLIEAWPA